MKIILAASLAATALVSACGFLPGERNENFCTLELRILSPDGIVEVNSARLVLDDVVSTDNLGSQDCYLMHIPDDVDAVLFADCVVWWRNGDHGTASDFGIPCPAR